MEEQLIIGELYHCQNDRHGEFDVLIEGFNNKFTWGILVGGNFKRIINNNPQEVFFGTTVQVFNWNSIFSKIV